MDDARKRQVDGRWHINDAWKAPFIVKLNDVMVDTYYLDDDYDEIRAYLVDRYGS